MKLTASKNNTSLYACGLDGPIDGTAPTGCKNTGSVTTEIPTGSAVAEGIVYVIGGSNTGTIQANCTSASDSNECTAVGVRDCQGTDNLADVTASHLGCGISVAAGISNSTGGENRGAITSLSTVGGTISHGLNNVTQGINYGEVTATTSQETMEAMSDAYGATGSGSVNHGTVTARHPYFARATGSDLGSSDALVSAHTTIFQMEANGAITKGGNSHARGSLRVSATNPAYSLYAENGDVMEEYFFVAPPSCPYHGGMPSGHRTIVNYQGLDGCFSGPLADARSETYEDMPPYVPSEEEEEDPTVGYLKVVDMGLYDRTDGIDERITKLNYFCGSFSYAAGGKRTVDVKKPETTNYDEVILKIKLTSLVEEEGILTVTLPEGLSFSKDKEEPSKIIVVPKTTYHYLEEPVYLLYSENYSDGYSLQASWEVQAVSTGELRSGSRRLAKISQEMTSWDQMHIERNLNEETVYDTESWTKDMFFGDPDTYSQNLAVFAAYLSEMMEDGNKARLEKRVKYNLTHMGFSKILLGGSSNGLEEEFVLAQKKVLTGDHQVKTILIFAIQGSDSLDDWLTNIYYYGHGDEHWNFAAIAYELLGYFQSYCKDMSLTTSDKNLRILVTGHSRGGAVANYFTGTFLNKNEKIRSARNTYSYNYAPVNVINEAAFPDRSTSLHHNIFNFANYLDSVPFVPGDQVKYGRCYVFNTEDQSHESILSLLRLASLNGWAKDKVLLKYTIQELIDAYIDGRLVTVGDAHSMRHYIQAVKTMPLASFGDFDQAAKNLTKIGEKTLKGFRARLSAVDLRWSIARGALSLTIDSQGEAYTKNHATGIVEDAKNMLAQMPEDQRDSLFNAIKTDLLNKIPEFARANPAFTKAVGGVAALLLAVRFAKLVPATLVAGGIFLGPIRGVKLCKKLFFHCPVDIRISDRSGNLLLSIVNDSVEYINSEDIYVIMYQDQKQIYLLNDLDCRVEVSGYADGTMDYSVSQEDGEGNAGQREVYVQIPVKANQTTVVLSNQNASYTAVDGKGQPLSPAIDSRTAERDSVSVTCLSDQSEAEISGGGSYGVGDACTVFAMLESDENSSFKGWYDESNQLVSSKPLYTFIAYRDITLTARYGKAPVPTPTLTPIPSKLSSPKAPSVTAVSSGLSLTWKSVDGAKKYTVYRKENNKTVKLGTTSKCKWTDKSVTNGTTYTYFLQASASRYTASEKGAQTTWLYLTPPGSVSPKSAKAKTVTVTWKKNAKAGGYELRYSLNKDMSSSKTLSIGSKSTTKKTIKKLSKNKTYYVQLRAVKKAGDKVYTSVWSSKKKVKVK